MLRIFLCVLLSASVASGTDWDQGSLREAIQITATNWDQLTAAVETPFPLLTERTVVYAFVRAERGECSPCDAAKDVLSTRRLPFDVRWTSHDPGYGTGTPTFYWKSNEGWTKLVGWWGADELIAAVERTTRTPSLVFPRQQTKQTKLALTPPEASPTPMLEVERVLSLLPKPHVGFVDFGCGDGRWCISAARRWGCRATGIEIDPLRAADARERVEAAGLSHLVTIIEGDVLTTDVTADVGVAYLYHDVLEKLKPRIERLRAFASYKHQPPGLPATRNGDSWIYTPLFRSATRQAVWDGQFYSHPVCSDPNCGMCNSIRSQLGQTSRPMFVQPKRKKNFLGFEWE